MTQRRYELSRQDGERLGVSLRKLDKLLDGQVYPADFCASIKAADDARKVASLTATGEA